MLVEEEFIARIAWLEDQIFEGLCMQRLLKSEIRLIEDKIEAFTSEYCGEIGAILRKLEYVDALINNTENNKSGNSSYNALRSGDPENRIASGVKRKPDTGPDYNIVDYDSEDKEVALDQEIALIYRKLVKLCHPDSNEADDPDSSDAFDILHTAYKQRDLRTMMLLEQIFLGNKTLDDAVSNNDDLECKLENLERLYMDIRQENADISKHKADLVASSAFTLQRRMKWAKMCGDDLITRIKKGINEELNSKISLLEDTGVTFEELKYGSMK